MNKEVRINTSPDNIYYEVVPCNISGCKIVHSDFSVHRKTSGTRWIEIFLFRESVWM